MKKLSNTPKQERVTPKPRVPQTRLRDQQGQNLQKKFDALCDDSQSLDDTESESLVTDQSLSETQGRITESISNECEMTH